ncbi:MAG: DUF4214 domain-containing protein [Acidimicrobiales bacterium]
MLDRFRRSRPSAALWAIGSSLALVAATAAPVGAVGGVDAPDAGGRGERPHALSADGTVHVTNAVVSSVDSLARFDTTDDSIVPLGAAVSEVAMASDGSVVATLDAGQTLRLIGSTGPSIVALPVRQPMSNIVLSGGGRFLAFAAPAADGRGLLVHRYDRSTGQLVVLPSDAGSTSRPIDISDDGGRVLIWRGEDTAIGQLGVFDVAASTLTKVTVEPTTIVDAALTPDGSSVYFASPSPQVGGVAAGIHLYRTTIATRLIQLVPVDVELGTTVEIATSGQLLAQRSPDDARMIQMIDVGDGRQWTQTIESATPGQRVTPVEISDDLTTMLVDIASCVGDQCQPVGPIVAAATGASDPLWLRWTEADRPLHDSVDRLYVAVTGRGADAAGRSFWISRLIAGDSLETVARGLLGSSEGAARFRADMTPEEVVEQALSGILGRPVTAGEIVSIISQAGNTSTAAIVLAAAQSSIAVEATGTAPPQTSAAGELIRLYRAVFGRFPDELGYRYWAAQQAGGLTLDAMIDSFAVSAEYRQRYGTNPSDAVAIAQLYRNVLDREPDAAGAAYWQEQLSNGVSRNVMLNSFVDSTENILRTGTQP